MATTVSMQPIWLDPGNFVYNAAKPTYYTELLSYQTLKQNAEVALAGGVILVETTTAEQQQAASSTYLTDFGAWLKTASEAVSAWLIEDGDSRALPVLAAAPLLPAIISGSVVLYKGVLAKMAIDTLSTVIRTVSQVQADRRNAELPRVMDKALNKSSWFGLVKESWLERISRNLETDENSDLGRMGLADLLWFIGHGVYEYEEDGIGHTEPVNTTDVLLLMMKKPKLLKLLLQAVISAGGDIETIDFDVLPGE